MNEQMRQDLLPSVEESASTVDQGQTSRGYLAIATFACASYALVVGPYLAFTTSILPGGDPFTYAIVWFRKIDEAGLSYLGALKTAFTGADGGWYQLMEILIALLAPVLTKEPASICLVNYVLWGLGAAAFFHLARRLGMAVGPAFVAALIPWLWPISYGFTDYSSTPVLALDSGFTGALHIAVAMSLAFALDPRRIWEAVLAGLAIGFAIWGRGNSLPVVALVVFVPCIAAVVRAAHARDRRAIANVIVGAAIAGIMTVEYYLTYFAQLESYYGAHLRSIEGAAWSLSQALPFIKNIPGIMMWHSRDATATLVLSWTSHVIPLVALIVSRQRLVAATGAVIYYVTFLINLTFWRDPQFTIDSTLYLWRPMLIGLSLSLISVLPPRLPVRIAPVLVGCLAWGVFWTWELTPTGRAIGRPKPAAVERFAVNMETLMPAGGRLAFLWNNNWNAQLLIYYRIKDGMSDPPLDFDPTSVIWAWYAGDAGQKEPVIAGVKKAFNTAAAIVIPEFVDDYKGPERYAINRFSDDWAPWINSPDAPRMRVIAIINESPQRRLLVLQREDIAAGRGEPLHLPWGNRSSEARPDYSANIPRF